MKNRKRMKGRLRKEKDGGEQDDDEKNKLLTGFTEKWCVKCFVSLIGH